MSKDDSSKERADRIGRIQAIVQEDYDRIQQTEDSYVVLNLTAKASQEDVADRYERYERFYRAENFQRLGDMDLTRKALEIRRSIGRAMVEIQGEFESRKARSQTPVAGTTADFPDVDPDAAALGDIYFRDGLTYLRLGDFNAACEHLQRACDYDPSRGIILANLAYTQFKLDPTDKAVVEETDRNLSRATHMEPNNPEVFAIVARFGINNQAPEKARRALERLEAIKPNHPRLARLKKRANF